MGLFHSKVNKVELRNGEDSFKFFLRHYNSEKQFATTCDLLGGQIHTPLK